MGQLCQPTGRAGAQPSLPVGSSEEAASSRLQLGPFQHKQQQGLGGHRAPSVHPTQLGKQQAQPRLHGPGQRAGDSPSPKREAEIKGRGSLVCVFIIIISD